MERVGRYVLVYDGFTDLFTGSYCCGESGNRRAMSPWTLQETAIATNDIVATILRCPVEFWKRIWTNQL